MLGVNCECKHEVYNIISPMKKGEKVYNYSIKIVMKIMITSLKDIVLKIKIM